MSGATPTAHQISPENLYDGFFPSKKATNVQYTTLTVCMVRSLHPWQEAGMLRA